MKLRQSVLIGSSVVLTIAGLLLVPYKGLGRLQAMLFGCGAISGFVGGVKGRTLEEEQENWESQILEAREHQKMIEQTTLPILQQEEMAIAQSRAARNVELQSLEHQQHLQTVKQLKFPGLLEAEMEEARRRSELEDARRGDRLAGQSISSEKAEIQELLPSSESDRPFAKDWTFDTLPPEYQWLSHFKHTSGLIWGNQGSGKSWLARAIAYMKQQMGYRVVVLDPDSNKYEWKNIESYHKPEEIKEFMKWYVKEIKDRYREFNDAPMGEEEWREKLWKEGKAISVICEEATTYKNVLPKNDSESPEQSVEDLLTDFYELGLSKSRKQEMPLTVVAHNNTQMIFGVKGLGQLIAKLLQVELEVEGHPITKKPISKGIGVLKLDSSNNWIPVKTPVISEKIRDFAVDSKDRVEGAIADSKINPESLIELDIEAQRNALTRIYELPEKEVAPWDEWLSESSTEEIDRLIDERRSRQDTPPDVAPETVDTSSADVSDTSEPKNVCDTSQGSYRTPEALPDKEPPRIWEVSDFAKHLPDRKELELFEQLCSYQDTSRAGSEIIKKAWKFSSGGPYRRLGQPCFVYIVNKHGSEAQKEFYAPFIKKCLAVNDNDSE